MTTKDIDSLKGIINKIQKGKAAKSKAAIILKDAVKAAKQEKDAKGWNRATIGQEVIRALNQDIEEPKTIVKKVIEKAIKENPEVINKAIDEGFKKAIADKEAEKARLKAELEANQAEIEAKLKEL